MRGAIARTKERYLLALLALSWSALLILVYRLSNGSIDGLLISVIPNLIASLITFVALYFALERHGIVVGEMPATTDAVARAEIQRHDQLEWDVVIRRAHALDIAVFYYGSWVGDNHDAFVEFFRNGGRLRIAVTDPSNKVLVGAAQKYFFPNLDPRALRGKIVDTMTALRRALDESGTTRGTASWFAFSSLLHYSFVLVDERVLYLSVYEQFRGPTVRAPVFRIDLTEDATSAEYWVAVRNRLMPNGEGRRVSDSK